MIATDGPSPCPKGYAMTSEGRHALVVRDVMTPDPTVVHPEEEVGPLLELLERRDFNAVPVADDAGNLASARMPEGVGMTAVTMQAHACDGVAGRSLQHETSLPSCPGGFLELRPAVAIEDRVIALVALLVALVHPRWSYSVTLGNRTGTFRWPRQMRRSLRWRVTERD